MFGRKRSSGGQVIYAVGDIHGRYDLLELMLELIAADAAELSAGARLLAVFLGDYVDRGPDSRNVLERLSCLESAATLRFLKGNHEAVMLNFLEDSAVGPQWSQFGGSETLASYGVAVPASAADTQGWRQARDELAASLPDAHLAFLRGLDLSAEAGDYFFAHAGVRPGRRLDAQTEQDLLWIREDFLGDNRALPKIVVHGHTPAPQPVWDRRRRIGVDTGAYVTGALTAARIEDGSVKFLAAKL